MLFQIKLRLCWTTISYFGVVWHIAAQQLITVSIQPCVAGDIKRQKALFPPLSIIQALPVW